MLRKSLFWQLVVTKIFLYFYKETALVDLQILVVMGHTDFSISVLEAIQDKVLMKICNQRGSIQKVIFTDVDSTDKVEIARQLL